MSDENKTLPLKYRPKSFDEFYGNKSMIESLKVILDRESGIPHCFLFEGDSGCGKTTVARIIANKLGCSDRDYREYNISDMRGIDTAREVIRNCKFAPIAGSVKIYVFDEFHKATNEFQNAILKVLEDTPSHVYFILCTTNPEKILKTIRGQRATIFKVNPLLKREMIKFLKDICIKEINEELPEKHLVEIANASNGSPRKALNILDQIIDIEDDEKSFQAIIDCTVTETTVKELAQYLLENGKKDNKKIRKMLRDMDLKAGSVEEIRYQLKGYMGAVYLNSGSGKSYKLMTLFLEPFHYSGREGLIDAVIMASRL